MGKIRTACEHIRKSVPHRPSKTAVEVDVEVEVEIIQVFVDPFIVVGCD